MSRLHEAFARATAEHRALLIGYLPAGFPGLGDDATIITAMIEAGVDAVEIERGEPDELGAVRHPQLFEPWVGGLRVGA